MAGVLRLNYQLLGASYADEPYVGGMGGLQRRGEEEKLRREKRVLKERGVRVRVREKGF